MASKRDKIPDNRNRDIEGVKKHQGKKDTQFAAANAKKLAKKQKKER